MDDLQVSNLTITEKRGIILFGECLINKHVQICFAYNPKVDKFTAICYDVYQGSGRLPEAKNILYQIGRSISKYINTYTLQSF
jgi:hypothetical protein